MTTTPSAEEIVLYEKDPQTKIATITFNRPEQGNSPTVAARLRYADLIHKADIDDDVKVLVIRGIGDDLGTGTDLPEFLDGLDGDDAERLREFRISDPDVRYPPQDTYRNMASFGPWFANAQSGVRSLQEFSKISILEVKGYCYGWHFSQAADADLVISADDGLFGDAAFRDSGWGPRMWTLATMMGIRKFQEMVFTGRPFTAAEMYDCNFVNSLVPRAELEAEVAKYAKACSLTRPTDTVHIQKSLFRSMKQHQGEYMGSLLTGMMTSMQPLVRADANSARPAPTDAAERRPDSRDVIDFGDSSIPAEFRLDKKGRLRP